MSEADALILNVDDDEAGRYAKTRILTRAGLRVAEAATGAEALEKAATLGPALVLLDVKLPDISGIEVCRRIKRAHPATLVLQISVAAISGADRVRGLEGGADSYLTQPVAPDELIAVIRALLRMQAAESALRQLNATLEARVAERTADLATVNKRLVAEIAERQRAEAMAEALYRRTPLPLHCLDASAHLLIVSDRWLEFLGYAARHEVIGRHITEFMPAEAAHRFREVVWPMVLTADGCDDMEIQLRRRDGTVVDILVSVRTERAPSGRFLRSMAALVDVTARKRAEEGLRQAQKMEVFGQLAGGIAHDMNNVLQTVLSGTRMLGLQAEDAAMVRRLSGLVSDAAERGAAIARRLLTFARRGELRAAHLDVAALLENVREVLSYTLGGRTEVAVEGAPRAGELIVFADKPQLETVLLNLAINARDAMPRGGTVTLSARMVPPAGEEWPRVALAVRDHGAGMSPATLARATEPFFTTKPKGQGTGLGLAMARNFAEQSGGDLVIDTEPGQGTTVTLFLPVSQAAEPDVAPAHPAPLATPSARLLVVDDDPLVRSVLGAVFERLGHRAEVLESGEEALRRLQDGAPCDLLLTDLTMPGLTGIDLLREARRQRPGLPCILLTGNLDEEATLAVTALSEGGPFAVLRKPMAPDSLGAAVDTLLSSQARAG
ncbi:hybrid sensor histidine kinase/response regulator [Roseomonas sp. M0104]|uniref:histidine kinase n=1 Tax=Teichococcus coralli TaxID=2545983 RepID=A0A845BDY6_9PROT|nr:response regulator [Pseudoroseomonas coralli]MXP63502.1 hybrid sensor histidine kinase/response regulator [Pseudoroseomonas coralli]